MRNLTHFMIREPVKEYWIPIVFVTSLKEDDETKYFLGFEDCSRNSLIEKWEKQGQIEALDSPISILNREGLWLDPEGGMWITSREDPVGYESKKLIDNIYSYM